MTHLSKYHWIAFLVVFSLLFLIQSCDSNCSQHDLESISIYVSSEIEEFEILSEINFEINAESNGSHYSSGYKQISSEFLQISLINDGINMNVDLPMKHEHQNLFLIYDNSENRQIEDGYEFALDGGNFVVYEKFEQTDCL